MAAQSVRIDLKGQQELIRKLQSLGRRVIPVVGKALNQEHEQIMTRATDKDVVPVDTGALKNTGIVLPPKTVGTVVVSEGGFGGAAVDYAVIVHETHKTRSKFYERPLMEALNGMDTRLAATLRREIQRLARTG